MSLTPEDLDQIKSLFSTEIATHIDPLKAAITAGDQGVAANVKRQLTAIQTELAGLKNPVPDDADDTDEGNKNPTESPATKALQSKLASLEAKLQEKDLAEKRSNEVGKIKAALTDVPTMNPALVEHLATILHSQWQLTEDNGMIFVGDKTLPDSVSEYIQTPIGSAYTIKPVTDGPGIRKGINVSSSTSGTPKTFEELMSQVEL